VPTADSSTSARVDGPFAAAVRAVADVGHLLRFRAAGRHRRTGLLAALLVGGATLAVMVVPAFAPGAGDRDGRALDVLVVLPTAFAAFALLALFAAASSGGGRELLARDPAAIHPVSPTTDHLGALLLAPLNIAWMLQAWLLLGSAAYGVGPGSLVAAQVVVLVWLAFATASAQMLAWSLEGVRRVPHGISVVRGLNVVFFGIALGLQLSNNLTDVFDEIPTRWIVLGMLDGFTGRWALTVGLGVVSLVVAVALGAVPAHIAAHRIPRDELKVESGSYPARTVPRTVLGTLVRADRASVWRAVPMRRGLLVLALGPALVALLGNLQWSTMTILPGLVASGGALLYGVNAWCLDSRGALWRESLPVPASVVFDARAYVLGEFLLAASVLTVVVAGLRAGVPRPAEATALAAALAVITVQVVGAAMRWSSQHPYAVDLRSSRATPAPPSRMVAYSARLALVTTVTGLAFSVVAQAGAWPTPLLLAVPMLAWSTYRLRRTRATWSDPVERARIVTTVAAA
jgi:hypothetical protein